MARPITVVACDRNGRVLRAERLKPWRLLLSPGAALIIETFGEGLPKVGDSVEVLVPGDGRRASGDGRR